jgi:hypothetical protein
MSTYDALRKRPVTKRLGLQDVLDNTSVTKRSYNKTYRATKRPVDQTSGTTKQSVTIHTIQLQNIQSCKASVVTKNTDTKYPLNAFQELENVIKLQIHLT